LNEISIHFPSRNYTDFVFVHHVVFVPSSPFPFVNSFRFRLLAVRSNSTRLRVATSLHFFRSLLHTDVSCQSIRCLFLGDFFRNVFATVFRFNLHLRFFKAPTIPVYPPFIFPSHLENQFPDLLFCSTPTCTFALECPFASNQLPIPSQNGIYRSDVRDLIQFFRPSPLTRIASLFRSEPLNRIRLALIFDLRI